MARRCRGAVREGIAECCYHEFMDELIFLVDEAPEGGYTARALGQPIFTEADDLGNLHQAVRDAVQCHCDEGLAPKVIRLHFVREEVIAL